MRDGPLRFFEERSDLGVLFIRAVVGFHLIYGTQDNVLSYERMLEFRDFLAARGVPWPLFAAHLSVYAQFLAGILFIVGAAVRWAGLVMVINFIAAFVIAHRGDPYPRFFPALFMLAGAAFFLFHGAGRHSIDARLERRRAHPVA
jgi:putative oxidoreductase